MVVACLSASLLHCGAASYSMVGYGAQAHACYPSRRVQRCSKGRLISNHGAAICGGTGITACVARVFSIHGVVVSGDGGAPVPCLLGEGRLKPPS
jgi:hypothetical protein